MAQVTLGGNPANTNGDLPANGTNLSGHTLTKSDLSKVALSDYAGKKLVLNIFPSVDTGVCAASVRHFNQDAASLENTMVLCISMDLPFAQARFCGAEGIENVVMLSDFRSGEFSKATGTLLADSAFEGLNARSVIVLNEEGNVTYSELVPEIGQEPNYEAALAAL